MLGLLAALALAAPPLALAAPPSSSAALPVLTAPGHWAPMPIVLRTAHSDVLSACVRPEVRFVASDGSEVIRRPMEMCGAPRRGVGAEHARLSGSLVQLPAAGGRYTAHAIFYRGPNVVSQADLGTVRVLPLWAYALAMLALLGALLAAGYRVATSPRRWEQVALAAALLATAPWWGRQLLGGQIAFLGLLALLVSVYRKRPGAHRFLLVASCATAVFLELYWGAITSGANWTAWVVSVTLLWLLYRGLRLVFRSERSAAWAVWAATLALAVVDVSQAIYKAFFLDYASAALVGTTGQVGQLLDSIERVLTFTHLLTLALPLMLVAAWALQRRLDPAQ